MNWSKRFRIVFLCASLCAASCGFWRGDSNANANENAYVAEELKSSVPFSTKEPPVFQTEIVVTANETENRFFTARREENRLTIFDYQTNRAVADLQTGSRRFVFAPTQKICAELDGQTSETTADDYLTGEWINRKTDAQFEPLEAENNRARYRVKLNDAARSEIVVSVDEQINLPVRQEFFTVKDGARTPTLVVELRNFSQSVEAANFELPKDCRRVSVKEFYAALGKRREKND